MGLARSAQCTTVNPLGAGRPSAETGIERRVFGGVLFLVAVWLVLFSRLFHLQLVQGDELRSSAQRQSVRTHRLEATRGIIFDRYREIMADSRPAFDVLVVAHELDDADATLSRVAGLIGEDPTEVREHFGDPRGRARFQALPIATDLARDQVVRVESRLWALPGVLTRVTPVRHYVDGDASAHVFGTLGEISAHQLKQRQFQGYRRGDVIGQSGIEGLHDRELRGRAGGRNVLVDAYGRELELLGEVEPQPGRNVVLTLDARMQRAAEEALDASERNGAIVALDPRTGEVLALANRPRFDGNLFATRIDSEAWTKLLDDPDKPLQNRALQGQYPPGSTYKVVTAIAGLEERLITPETEVYCSGSYRLGRRRYRCWKRGGHGLVRLHRAIVQSCDVFFYQTAKDVGVDKLAYYARALGLGSPTGIELKREAGGLVPTSAWKERRFGERWIEGETLSVGIGQGFNLWTPMQLALVYSSIANGGRRMRPFLTKRIEDPLGDAVWEGRPKLVAEVPISVRTLRLVRAGLRGVVHDERGTGWAMRRLPDEMEAAGKTGTAQVISTDGEFAEDEDDIPIRFRDHAWFVTYVPAEKPEVLVAALIEHGGHGSSAAAPAARKVVDAYLERRSERRGLHARNR